MGVKNKQVYALTGLTTIGINAPTVTVGAVAPTTALRGDIGDIYVNNVAGISYMLVNIAGGSYTWSVMSAGAGDLDQLTGDGGTATPVAGIINIAGGTNITTAGAGAVLTVNLDAAITLATSVSSPLYTVAAATDLAITSAAGQDIIIKMGDNAGANVVSFIDSDDVEVFSIDSNGGIPALGALTVNGLLTANASATIETGGAALSLAADNSGDAVIVGGGTTARAITIGQDAAAHTIAIGQAAAGAITVDTAAGVSIDGATASNFTVTGAAQDLTLASVGGSVNVNGSQAAADAVSIQASNAAGGIDIDAGTAGIDVLVTGGGFSIDGQAASNITVTAAGEDLSLQGVGGAVNVTSTQGENDAIHIEASAANGGVEILAGTGGVRIGDEADCTGLTFGNIAPTANRNITIGSGTVVTASVTDDISIGDGGATTNADSIKHVDINNGGVTLGVVRTYIGSGAVTSGTHTTEIATGNVAAGTATVSISTGTGTKTVTVGNADANTTIALNGATAINTNVNAAFSANVGTSTGTVAIGNIANSGAMSLESSSTVDVDAAGAVSLNSTGGALNIGNDADAQAINMGTGAAARTITIGNTTGATGLVLQSGTGEITMTGTVKQIDAELMGTTGVYIPAITMSPVMTTAATTGGAPTGATGDVNLMSLQSQAIMEQFVTGAGQTIIAPRMSANGLLISGDLTATEGFEFNIPYLQYTIGTSPAFFFELTMYINDMDGSDPYVFGFRKTEANNATFGNYDTYATIGMNAATSVDHLVTLTELNAGGQTATALGDLWGGDATANTMQVLVSAAGVVTYTLNGAAVTGPAAFTFDAADVVIPIIRISHSAAPTQVCITSMRIGYQA